MTIKNSKAPWAAGKPLLFAIKSLLAVGLMGFLFSSGRLDVQAIVKAYHYPDYLMAGVLCCALSLIVPIIRWWVLAHVQKLDLGLWDAIRLTMVGHFFSLFIPGGSGGDVVRAAYAVRDCPERKAQALTIAFMDRGLGLHALLLSCVFMFFFDPHLLFDDVRIKPWFLVIEVLLLIGTAVPLLLLWPRTNGIVIRLLGKIIGGEEAWAEAMTLYRKHWNMVALAYLLSIGILLFNILNIHFMMNAIGATPTLKESIAVVPFVILANTLPLTPGGMGAAEGASAGLYALVGQAGGANGMLLTRFFMILMALGGLPFFLMDRRRLKSGNMGQEQLA